MRLAFEFNFDPMFEFKQTYRELVCKVKGHNYVKWKKPKHEKGYLGLITSMWLDTDELMTGRKKDKQCTRCFDVTYKKSIEKPRTVSFARYSDLK